MTTDQRASERITKQATAMKIETEDGVGDVIALLRVDYDRVVARHGLPIEVAP